MPKKAFFISLETSSFLLPGTPEIVRCVRTRTYNHDTIDTDNQLRVYFYPDFLVHTHIMRNWLQICRDKTMKIKRVCY